MRELYFAPHPDDEVLGCGGTIARHAAENEVYVCVVTKGVEPLFSDAIINKTREEQKKAHKFLGVKECYYLDFPAVMLEEEHRYEINAAISRIIAKVKPDTVYIPHFGDMQKDHKIVSEAVMVAVRPKGEYCVKKVYSYETLSETEWNIPHVANVFIPNRFVDISDVLEVKLKAISMFESQMGDFPNPRSVEAVKALASLRGSTISVNAAESFCVIREID